MDSVVESLSVQKGGLAGKFLTTGFVFAESENQSRVVLVKS